MNYRAIVKARERLTKAQTSFAAMLTSRDYAIYRSSWADFLFAFQGVYNALEAGAKTAPKSTEWMGRERHKRKKDELLQYIHQARHAEEHGIQLIVVNKPAILTVVEKSTGSVFFASAMPGMVKFEPDEEAMAEYEFNFSPPEIEPLPVTVRGVTYSPPKTYLGYQIMDRSPHGLAFLGLQWLRQLIARAEKLR